MAESRDDFIIAIRSAFLKKSTKQKSSLLTLVFFSIFIIVLSNLNFKAINLKIKSLLRETRDEIKSKGSQVGEINTNGNFVKKIRDFLQENQNIKFKLEVVSLRDSKTVEPIVVEINILKIES